jgi:hypothetical protein
MKRVTYYATKKRVSEFIESEKNTFKSNEKFLRQIRKVLIDLKKFNGEKHNVNQINFFKAVEKYLLNN